MWRRHISNVLVFGAAILSASGCATTQGGEGGDALGPDECAFVVANQTESVLGVSVRSSDGPLRTELRPTGQFRFERSCDGGEVAVTATPREAAETRPGASPRPPRDVIERTVAPEPGRVVWVPLRW